jgi:quercetin dioxygenase-like cupin family protein
MIEEVIHHRGTTLVRRLVLQPGEAIPWHVDPHHRVTVVLRGDLLWIEYKDGGEPLTIRVKAGQTDWDEPSDRPHRGVNAGSVLYEEIAIFLLDHPGATPQPRA